MTDRIKSLTVLLETPIRVDDAEGLINAINQLRGVASVTTQVATAQDYWAKETARLELVTQMIDLITKKEKQP